MKRILVGMAAGLSIWFGSALAAEAQQITPTGPMAIQAGTNSWNYTATIYLPTPMSFRVTTCVFKNNVFQCQFVQNVPNPGTNYYNFTQLCNVSFNVSSGDTVTFKTSMLYNKVTTNGPDWNVTVTGTRPTSTVTKAGTSGPKRTAPMALANGRRQD